jgi:cytochrome o ubiquinol oxidase subunit 1
MFGKLSWEAVPFHEPIVMVTIAMIALGGLALSSAAITYFKKWTYLWTEWLTSVDHKKIGVMYIVAMVMLLRGFADAIMMRTQLAMATEGPPGYLPPEHYDQIFTAHGVIMIIFMAMPFFTGLMNLAVPLQIGARDVAFPFLNSLSFWLLVAGVVLINLSPGRRRIRQDRLGCLSAAVGPATALAWVWTTTSGRYSYRAWVRR